jgi:hypothetical protein
MLIARDREASDDAPFVLRDEDGRVGVAADRTEVPALIGGGAPPVRRHEPALGFAADGVA